MTIENLNKIIQKYNIPSNVILMSDSGWECSKTDMDGVYYNKKENIIVFTQHFNYNETYYVEENGWIPLELNNELREQLNSYCYELDMYDEIELKPNTELHNKSLEQGFVYVLYSKKIYKVNIFDDIALTKNFCIPLTEEYYGSKWAFTKDEFITSVKFDVDTVIRNTKTRLHKEEEK